MLNARNGLLNLSLFVFLLVLWTKNFSKQIQVVIDYHSYFAKDGFRAENKNSSWENFGSLVLLNSPATNSGVYSSHTNNISLESLRIAAFGSSKTFGTGLDNPEIESFVMRLSAKALNFGLRATHADYPSLCLYSMVGEQIFDVIILEFRPVLGEQHKNFQQLLRRLRTRFPVAILILLLMPMPFHDIFYKGKYLYDHILTLNLTSHHDPSFEETIRNLTDLTWNPQIANDAYNTTIQSVGGFTVVFPDIYDNFHDHILENAKYFGCKLSPPWDFVHPNALGHKLAADRIRQKVGEFLFSRPPVASTLGEWLGGKDACVSWFNAPHLAREIPETNMRLSRFPSGRMAGADRGLKWALDVDRDGGTLAVNCSKFPSCNIYLSYMAHGPVRLYPRVLISVEQHPNQVFVDPLIEIFHLRKTVFVGTVNFTTKATVAVKPLPEDANSTKARFRITGVMLTPFYAVLDMV